MGSFARQLVLIFLLHILVVLVGLGFGMRAGWAMEFCFEDADGIIAALAGRYGEADMGGAGKPNHDPAHLRLPGWPHLHHHAHGDRRVGLHHRVGHESRIRAAATSSPRRKGKLTWT
jgi:hypothetical protein